MFSPGPTPHWAVQETPVTYPPASTEDTGNASSIPGSEKHPGGGHGNPLQYSSLENPMDRGAWWAKVHGITKELDKTEHEHKNPFTINSYVTLIEPFKNSKILNFLFCQM